MSDAYPQEVNRDLLKEVAAQCLMDSQRWFPHYKADLPFLALCMCGEAGEVANKVKKIVRGDKTLEEARDDIVEEVVDVFTYLMNIVGELDFDLYAEYTKKRTFNEERWGPSARVGAILDYEGRAMATDRLLDDVDAAIFDLSKSPEQVMYDYDNEGLGGT